ncbi:MAG: NUDIX domain-containing protein [Lachnospiraceae bacterium]|nr:NUDIX domain-containing protein [Lachnospiraceae bacterium]
MEIWDLYTVNREKTGLTVERGKKQPEGYYRVVVHACIFNRNAEMLIQQRQPFKDSWSNMWDITVGGSAISGESSPAAIERELKEELGIDISFEKVRPALTINFANGFDDIYLMEMDIDMNELKLQQEEVAAVKWTSCDEILQMIQQGVFIPYHKSLIELLFSMRKHIGTHTREDNTIPSE